MEQFGGPSATRILTTLMAASRPIATEVLRPRFDGLTQVGGRAPVLELVRFADRSRQLIVLEYTNE
jgi:hypothetical protein